MTKNFYHAIKPMLVLSKIFGTISFEFREKGYKISKCNAYFRLLVSLLYLILTGYIIWNRKNYLLFSLLVTTTDNMQYAANALLVVTIWVSSAFWQKKNIINLKKITDLDKDMRKLGVWISYDKLNRSIYIQMAVRFLLNILCCSYQIFWLDYTVTFGTFHETILYMFISYVPSVVNTVTCLEISIYISILRCRFKILNKHLAALQTTTNTFINDSIKIIKLPTFLGTKLKMLHVVCPLHHELSKMSELINERFGLVLLMLALNTFIATVANLYISCKAWQETSPQKLSYIIGALLWCVMYIAETSFICYMCNITAEEANESGVLIHKIDTDDNDVKDQIQMFSLQIAHKRVEFSAAGFFPINYTLLFSIIGGVTTNLVILIQFSAN